MYHTQFVSFSNRGCLWSSRSRLHSPVLHGLSCQHGLLHRMPLSFQGGFHCSPCIQQVLSCVLLQTTVRNHWAGDVPCCGYLCQALFVPSQVIWRCRLASRPRPLGSPVLTWKKMQVPCCSQSACLITSGLHMFASLLIYCIQSSLILVCVFMETLKQ